ncbi:MAG: FG-GAP-like repeat-containing protein [Isosphaeraceae bacterium]
MKRRFVRLIRLVATLGAILLVAGMALIFLTDPEPGRILTQPSRLVALLPGGFRGPNRAPVAPDAKPARPAAPRVVKSISEDWLDESGYSFAAVFSGPVTDATSIDEVRTALERRAEIGLGLLRPQLAQLRPDDPEAGVKEARLNLIIGSLLMYKGQFEEAGRHFESILAHSRGSDADRANLEAMVGLAALRRGETENCVACMNETSCIFPLAPEAIHQRPAGSREAIRRFSNYLEKRPDDLGVQWLLNIAYMTLGEYPDKVPTRWLIPIEPFRSRIDIGRFPNIVKKVGLDARGPNMAGGCVADDFNGDGRIDLFTSCADPTMNAALFVNAGNGTFDDVSESAGLMKQVAALNAKQADFDNDGNLDLFLMRGAWEMPRRPSLLRNLGGGKFVDVTVEAGLATPIASQGASWGDYDNDGLVDLYVPGENIEQQPDIRNLARLYHNNGNGTFTDVAEKAGVRNDGFGKGSDWGDYDDDGDLDLYVSNLGQPNRLYRNNGDGTFTDVAEELGVFEPIHSFACWWWDYDNDGRLDLWVNPYSGNLNEIVKSHLGLATTGERPRLFHNEGPGKPFRDVTKEAGLWRVVIPMGSNFGDLDNDGLLDIYLGTGRPPYKYLVPNVMFKNVDGSRFEDVTTSTGTGHLQKGHGVAFADWDQDGDSDVFLEAGGAVPGDRAGNILFQNPGHGRHWVNLRLIGTRTNRGALGARVTVETTRPDGTTARFHRMIGSGGSFGGNPLATTIGLNDATRATITVRWPVSQSTQVVRDVPLDHAIEITEGREGFKPRDYRRIPLPD